MAEEHPFAQYIRILGKGKHGSRALTEDEAYQAMGMILGQQVQPIQLGAFLMLMRVKEETPAELAGFVRAAREAIERPADMPQVQLDWSTYAGKRRQLPWFLLSALLLAESGISVFMHGSGGRKDDRVYTPEALAALGVEACRSLDEASARIKAKGFAYVGLDSFSPLLSEIMELRPLLGLRSPVHTLARMINPFSAPVMLQGIFHPGYRNIHQETGLLLKQPHMAVLKGEGGEIERNPDTPCLVQSVRDGALQSEEWPAMFKERHLKDETMDVGRLKAVWSGALEDEYGTAAVIGTAAIALKALGKADSMQGAQELAAQLWDKRAVAGPRAA